MQLNTTGLDPAVAGAFKKVLNKGIGTDNLNKSVSNNLVSESGSNDNGYWRKWADGTLECFGTVSLGDVAITTAHGNVYVSAAQTLALPIEFTSILAFNLSATVTSSHVVGVLVRDTTIYCLWRGTSATVEGTVVRFHAIGRWE